MSQEGSGSTKRLKPPDVFLKLKNYNDLQLKIPPSIHPSFETFVLKLFDFCYLVAHSLIP